MTRHPSESNLALFSGGDLSFLANLRAKLHVQSCVQCREIVDQFTAVRERVSRLSEFPDVAGLNQTWGRLCAEMKANIRLGLAAGECVNSEPPAARFAQSALSGAHTLLAYAGVIMLVVAGLWLQRPSPQADSIVEASGNGIELKQGGQMLGLGYGRAKDVNYSASARGAMGARYVDADTGYVTVINVNVQ